MTSAVFVILNMPICIFTTALTVCIVKCCFTFSISHHWNTNSFFDCYFERELFVYNIVIVLLCPWQNLTIPLFNLLMNLI